jgi:hypothetical protein
MNKVALTPSLQPQWEERMSLCAIIVGTRTCVRTAYWVHLPGSCKNMQKTTGKRGGVTLGNELVWSQPSKAQSRGSTIFDVYVSFPCMVDICS